MSEKKTFGERLIERLGGVSKSEMSTIAQRSYEAGFSDGGEDEPISGTLKRYGYRRMTTGNLRDFHDMSRDTVLDTVWTLWQSSPIAKRVLVIKRSHILGGGVSPKAGSDDLQKIVTSFWEGNHLDKERAKEFTLQLFLFGSQCYPAFVRKADGYVRLGYIDPEDIQLVVVHPENSLEPWAVVLKENLSYKLWESNPNTRRRVYRIIRRQESVIDERGQVKESPLEGKLVTADQATLEPWEMKMLKTYGLEEYTGSCFYEKVNAVSNQPYGYSDLLQQADWIDQADETLFALADREQMAGFFSWDVTLENADDAKVRERSAWLRDNPPGKGTVNVHNNSEAWEFNYPDLKQPGTIETFNALINLIMGGMGYPRHWFGFGDDTNRATAEAQGDPTWRSLEDDQGIVKGMFLKMCEFARDQAEIAGFWKPGKDEDQQIDIPMPEMTSKDLSRLGQVFQNFALALLAARDAGWITQDTAAEAWAKLMAELGIQVDYAAELGDVEDQKKAGELEDGQKINDELTQALEGSLHFWDLSAGARKRIGRMIRGEILGDDNGNGFHRLTELANPPNVTKDGVMVGFVLPGAAAKNMAIKKADLPDAESILEAGDLHITLVFLGRIDEQDLDPEDLTKAVADFAGDSRPIGGVYRKVKRFSNPDSDYGDAVYADFESQDIADFRERLVSALGEAGFKPAGRGAKNFVAHTTLAYIKHEDETPDISIPETEVDFANIYVFWGERAWSYKLSGAKEGIHV